MATAEHLATESRGASTAATTTSGFAIAGDKTAAKIKATAHARRVARLKVLLPVAALATVGVYFASMIDSNKWGEGAPRIAMPKIIPEKLTMANPYYEGFNPDGSRYWIKADTAEPNLKDLTRINLNGITGELTGTDKTVTKLSADRGVYFSRANRLDLMGRILITEADRLRMWTGLVTIDTKAGTIHVRRPLVVISQAGTIRSKSAMIRYRSKEYTFLEDVTTTLKQDTAGKPKPSTGEDSASSAAQTGLFGGESGPVEITANRLDVDDTKKTALFSGGVLAKQAGATLESSDMLAEYEGSAVPTGGAAEDSKADVPAPSTNETQGKLKRIRVANPLTITQSSGEVIRASSADFDAVENVARLNGAFSLQKPPATTATADLAEMNQNKNQILLSGNVNLKQGDNTLQGETLRYDTAGARMELSGGGSSANRIQAVFKQTAKPPTAASSDKAATSNGIPFGGSFKAAPGQPVRIEATRLTVNDKTRQAVFQDDVRVNQGNFVMRANQIAARYTGSAALASGNTAPPAGGTKQDAPELTVVRAKGAVKIVSDDGQTATGDWADIDMKTNTAVLGGKVVLAQGKNVVRGTRLEIDMNTGLSALKSEQSAPVSSNDGWASSIDSDGPNQGRPSAVFYPGEFKERKSGQAKKPSASDGWSARTAP